MHESFNVLNKIQTTSHNWFCSESSTDRHKLGVQFPKFTFTPTLVIRFQGNIRKHCTFCHFIGQQQRKNAFLVSHLFTRGNNFQQTANDKTTLHNSIKSYDGITYTTTTRWKHLYTLATINRFNWVTNSLDARYTNC